MSSIRGHLGEKRCAELYRSLFPGSTPPTHRDRARERAPRVDTGVSDTDFVVTAHALERMEARWPSLVEGMSDEEIAVLIHEEVHEAFRGGRYAFVPPVELASLDPDLHIRRRGVLGETCWTRDKKRGYVFREGHDGLVVMTVTAGFELARAIDMKLRRGIRRQRAEAS